MARKLKWTNTITNIQSKILEALARYKYLTFSQMLKMDVGTTQYQYLWKQTVSLRDRTKPLVACNSFPNPNPRKGKVESIYYLTKQGRDTLVEDLFYPEDEIKFQIGNSIAYRDYDHRKKQIDFQISLDRWIDSSDKLMLDYFDTYYDKSGNNRTAKNLRAKTRIDITISEYMIPDAAFQISDCNGESDLFLFEMCNGKDTKRILKQVHQHARALISKTTHVKYNFDERQPYHILLLFTLESTKKAVINRMIADKSLSEICQYFLFQSYEKVEYPDFFTTWVTVHGEAKQIGA